jgi:hypothetical protein
MKTFTDTDRLDYVLQHLRENSLEHILTRQIGIGDDFDRSIIDAAMRVEYQQRRDSFVEQLQRLREEKTRYEQSIASISTQLAELEKFL